MATKWERIGIEIEEPPPNVNRILQAMEARGIVPPGFGRSCREHNCMEVKFAAVAPSPYRFYWNLAIPKELFDKGYVKNRATPAYLESDAKWSLANQPQPPTVWSNRRSPNVAISLQSVQVMVNEMSAQLNSPNWGELTPPLPEGGQSTSAHRCSSPQEPAS